MLALETASLSCYGLVSKQTMTDATIAMDYLQSGETEMGSIQRAQDEASSAIEASLMALLKMTTHTTADGLRHVLLNSGHCIITEEH